MNLTPNEVIHKVRKTAGISQEQLSKLIDLDQASISRIEKGKQSIQLDLLLKLSDLYGLNVEQLVTGAINYYDLSIRFGKAPKILPRYRGTESIYFREILPFVFYLRRMKGDLTVEQLLTKLSLQDLIYLSPSDKISAYALIDIVKESLEQKFLTKKDIPLLIRDGLNLSTMGEIYSILENQKNSLQLITNYLASSQRLESFFSYSVIDQEKNELTTEFRIKNEELGSEILTKNLGAFFLKLKENYFKSLLVHFNKGHTKVKLEGNPFETVGLLRFEFK